MSRKAEPPIAYLRTFSAGSVGADKDSDKRQRIAIQRFAKSAGFQIVSEYYDAAVSGADPVQARPRFPAMLERIEGNGIRAIIVETASRFGRGRSAKWRGAAAPDRHVLRLVQRSYPG